MLPWAGEDRSGVRLLEAKAREAVEKGDFPLAERLAQEILSKQPESCEGLLIAGHAAAGMGHHDDALRCYFRIPDDGSPQSLFGQCLAADMLLFRCGRAREAERRFRGVLERDPNHGLAHERLAVLLDVEGRRWESEPHFLAAFRQGRIRLVCCGSWAGRRCPARTPPCLSCAGTPVRTIRCRCWDSHERRFGPTGRTKRDHGSKRLLPHARKSSKAKLCTANS